MRWNVRALCFAAAVAALYAAVTVLLAPIGSGAVQLRVSEALTLLPVLTPAAVPGLFVGCLLANLLMGAVWYDVVFGSLATLAAAALTRRLRERPALAAAPPVLVNAVVIGLVLRASLGAPLFLTMLTVGAGQAVACYGLGLPLLRLLRKLKTPTED